MDNTAFVPNVVKEKRKQYLVGMTKQEKALFDTYAESKGWAFAKALRIGTRAAMLMEYKKANSIEEAINKSLKLDIDGRSR